MQDQWCNKSISGYEIFRVFQTLVLLMHWLRTLRIRQYNSYRIPSNILAKLVWQKHLIICYIIFLTILSWKNLIVESWYILKPFYSFHVRYFTQDTMVVEWCISTISIETKSRRMGMWLSTYCILCLIR